MSRYTTTDVLQMLDAVAALLAQIQSTATPEDVRHRVDEAARQVVLARDAERRYAQSLAGK